MFQPWITVFVKDSNKEYDTFPKPDFKISKLKIPSFPILDISSQKSRLCEEFN